MFCSPLLTQQKRINIAQSPAACRGLSSGFTTSVLTPPGATSNAPGGHAVRRPSIVACGSLRFLVDKPPRLAVVSAAKHRHSFQFPLLSLYLVNCNTTPHPRRVSARNGS